MLIKALWNETVTIYSTPITYLWLIIMSLILLPFDLLLSPFEIIAYIIYKFNKEK